MKTKLVTVVNVFTGVNDSVQVCPLYDYFSVRDLQSSLPLDLPLSTTFIPLRCQNKNKHNVMHVCHHTDVCICMTSIVHIMSNEGYEIKIKVKFQYEF